MLNWNISIWSFTRNIFSLVTKLNELCETSVVFYLLCLYYDMPRNGYKAISKALGLTEPQWEPLATRFPMYPDLVQQWQIKVFIFRFKCDQYTKNLRNQEGDKHFFMAHLRIDIKVGIGADVPCTAPLTTKINPFHRSSGSISTCPTSG